MLNPASIESGLAITSFIAAVGICISCIERLWNGSFTFGFSKVLAEESFGQGLGSVLQVGIFSRLIPVLQLLFAVAVVVDRGNMLPWGVELGGVAVFSALSWLQNPYACNGADHMSLITFVILTISASHASHLVKWACALFLCGQVLLSYVTAGLYKAMSPEWRNGTALAGILNTDSFGHAQLGRFLRHHTHTSQTISIVIISWQLFFPITFIMSKDLLYVYLGIGIAFHMGTAFCMRLNKFLWAFLAVYPLVVLVHSRSLQLWFS